MELTISELIQRYQTTQDDLSFSILLERFKPLIKKYAKRLYYLEFEDSQQELTLAVYEALNNMTNLENEYACISYLTKSIYHRFCKLYSVSAAEQKRKDTQVPYDNLALSSEDIRIKDQLFYYDCKKLLNSVNGSKRSILCMLIKGYSDREIADHLHCSRQYINRIKKSLLTREFIHE
ncbi:MAG: sigma-70 family RNA polymerase sigma factor [Clostridium sp.]|nr:sigma-70 family RNA polymerase sigma factor [Clostridium sp.]